jgi:metal-responsive CopG/Arc/MetJ family transcriptional regulator
MKNVQISFDEELLETVDALAASSQRSRSAVVREALKTWIRRQQVEEFEDAWIRKLKENPQEQEEADAWVEANSWSDE